jgi:very-short-patch-repair endonuclease
VGVNQQTRFNRTSLKTALARRLRRNSTEVELRLWQKLRNKQLGVDFRRQHPAGNFILDFYCPALRLAIELDGGQHAEIKALDRDEKRRRWLAERGATLLRYWNSEVTENLTGVLEDIAAKVAQLESAGVTPAGCWRATPTRIASRFDLPLSGGGEPRRCHGKIR